MRGGGTVVRSVGRVIVGIACVVALLGLSIVAAAQVIDVQRPAGTSIPYNGTDAQGSKSASAEVVLTYTVENTGAADLNVTGIWPFNTSNVTTGTISPASFTVSAGLTQDVEVRYTPDGDGAFSFQLDFESNATNYADYYITVSGTGTAPKVNLERPSGTTIAHNGNDAQGLKRAAVQETVTYTVRNTGSETLNITNITSGGITNVSVDDIVPNPNSFPAIAAAGTETFDLSYTPTADGAFSVDFYIASDDPASPYIFTVSGTADGVAPGINSLVRADPDPTNSASVDYTVNFSEWVSDVETTDFVLVRTGTADGTITSVSSSTGTSVTLTVTGVTGDGTLRVNFDYDADDSVVDIVGNPANADYTGEPYDIDNTAPAVDTIDRADADPTNAASVDFTVTFSESVTDIDTTDFVLALTGSAAGTINSVSAASGTVVTVTVTGVAGDGTLGLNFDYDADDNVIDGAGNPAVADFTGQTYTVDNTAPTVGVSIVDASLSDSDNESTVTFTVSEATTNFTVDDLTVVGGVVSGFSGSGTDYSATFTANDGIDTTGSVTVNAGTYTDAAGNLGSSGSDTVDIDTLNPTVTVDIVDASLSDTDNTSVVTFTFSEAVIGFDLSDVTDVNGSTTSLTGGGSNYSATFTADDGIDAVGSVTVDASSYTDTYGNLGATGSDTVSIDTENPTIASVTLTPSTGYRKVGDTVGITVTASGNETGLTPSNANFNGQSVALAGQGDGTYTGTYTVVEGHPDATNPEATGITLTDGAGNVSGTGASSGNTLIVDANTPAAPSTPDMTAATDTGSSTSDDITKDQTPDFTGTAEAGTTVRIYSTLDGLVGTGTASGGTWSITTSTLQEGTHTITATATDAAGNTSVASTGLPVEVDITAPATPCCLTFDGVDTGQYSSDRITMDTTPTVTADTDSSEPLSTTLYANGSPAAAATSYCSCASRTITANSMADGEYDFTATTTDVAGNESLHSAALDIEIDTTPPTCSVPVLASVDDTGRFDDDHVTQGITPTYEGTATDSASGIWKVTAYSNLPNCSAYDDPSSSSYSVNMPCDHDEGTATVYAIATDVAGNEYQTGDQIVIIDRTDPSCDIPDLHPDSDTGESNSDDITQGLSPRFTGGASDGNAGLWKVEIRLSSPVAAPGTHTFGLESNPPAPDTGPATGTYDVTYIDITEGPQTVRATVYDLAGNFTDAASTLSVTADRTGPTVSVPDLAAASDTGRSDTDDITQGENPQFTGTISDTYGVWKVDVVGSAPSQTVTDSSVTGGSDTYDVTLATLNEGWTGPWAVGYDVAGNTTTTFSAALTIDRTAPSCSVPDLLAADDSGRYATDDVTQGLTPQFDGSAFDDRAGVWKVDVTADDATSNFDDSSPFYSVELATLSEGARTVVATVTDVAGNTYTSSDLSVTVDRTAPTGSVPDLYANDDTGKEPDDDITQGYTPRFDGTSSDPTAGSPAVASGVWKVDVTADDTTTAQDASSPFYTVELATLSEGVRTVAATVTDVAGNTYTTGNLTVNVDRTDPTCSIPDLLAADDTGYANDDNITQGLTPQFDGTTGDAVAGSPAYASGPWTVQVDSTDGQSETDATNPGSGTYTVEMSSDLAFSAPYSRWLISATVTDIAGNDATFGSLTVWVDRQTPWVDEVDATTAPACIGDGCYTTGDSFDVLVTFNESVYTSVTVGGTTGGQLDIGLNLNTADWPDGTQNNDSIWLGFANIPPATTTPTAVWDEQQNVETYTVQNGDNACWLDVNDIDFIGIPGTLLRDLAGNEIVYPIVIPTDTIGTLHFGANRIVVDTVPPDATDDPEAGINYTFVQPQYLAFQEWIEGVYRIVLREDTEIYIDVLTNDPDNCPEGLHLLPTSTWPALPKYGTASLFAGSPPFPASGCSARVVRYIPPHDYTGPDDFTYRMEDCSLNERTARVDLYVFSRNIVKNTYYVTFQGLPVSFALETQDDLLLRIADHTTFDYTFELLSGPMHGLLIGDVGNVTYDDALGLASVNMTYVPAADVVDARELIEWAVTDPFAAVQAATVDIEIEPRDAASVEASPVFETSLGALVHLVPPVGFDESGGIPAVRIERLGVLGEVVDVIEGPAIQSVISQWSGSETLPILEIDTAALGGVGVYRMIIPFGDSVIVVPFEVKEAVE